jgi:hypothetical protein
VRKAIGITVGALATAGVIAAFAPTTACTNHQCDAPLAATVIDGGGGPDDAGVVSGDPNAWESSPAYGPWLSFPAQITYQFRMPPAFAGRAVENTSAYLSVAPDQTDPGAVWVTGSGNAAEFYLLPAGPGDSNQAPTIVLFNDTCAQYWVRVVITFAPADAAAPSDTGTDAADDGAASDADTSDTSDALPE